MGSLQAELGKRVRDRRQALGLSQEELAERANIHWTYVSGIERGKRNPSLSSLAHLATALDLRLEDLIKGLR